MLLSLSTCVCLKICVIRKLKKDNFAFMKGIGCNVIKAEEGSQLKAIAIVQIREYLGLEMQGNQ